MTTPAATLRSLLARPDRAVLAPGCYDALTASLIERAGFEAAYLSGASIAYTRLGRPDIGLTTAAEVENVIANIRDRCPDLPLVVDADTGFGNAMNVQRTVRTFERAGASAIQLEDQLMPKRCGHLAGKRVVPAADMVGKIKAACDARRDASTIIIARTDALGVNGFDDAMARAAAYVDAGCDLLFVEAPQDEAQMRTVSARFAARVPLLANMVEGGTTPIRDAASLAAAGFKLVIFPGAATRVLVFALEKFFADLKRDGSSAAWRDRMLDLKGLNAVLGTDALLEAGRAYDPEIQDA
ncbi:isocitrate lyase/PEP mutase family protein [Roseiterribacter gracilis]|uniref:2-methylisocitrate lyase n=1 Tax=Roseiterribacter gracilis TaxID=2812848 RepID=A0A8S8XD32_9PROT|nr:isocitrate lyase-family enzyme [Rhodospirillales bacterium TMPK1]